MSVLKNVSHRSMKTFYKLSDYYKKQKMVFYVNPMILLLAKNLDQGKNLLKQIDNDLPRYSKLDRMIEKYTSSKSG